MPLGDLEGSLQPGGVGPRAVRVEHANVHQGRVYRVDDGQEGTAVSPARSEVLHRYAIFAVKKTKSKTCKSCGTQVNPGKKNCY